LQTLSGIEIEPEVHDAYLKINVESDREMLIKSNFLTVDHTVSDARIACHRSHIQVLKKFLNDTYAETCLIFEDDLRTDFSTIELKIIFNSIKEASKNLHWDVINLGRCWDRCGKIKQNTGILIKSSHSLCRHSYIVSRKGAEKIINQSLPMNHKPGDNIIAQLNVEGKLEYLSTKVNIFNQNRKIYGSTLGNWTMFGAPPACSLW